MSFTRNGVKLAVIRRKYFYSFIVKFFELLLSVLFIISLAGLTVFPNQVQGALGVSKNLSYQGRLTNTSGDPLGGGGTTYCMRFSIWDVATGGIQSSNQLWPKSGGIPVNPASNSVTVTNGVFNVGIGEVNDLSAFDFSSNDTVFLNAEVYSVPTSCSGGSWEALSPRQRIDAAAYARVAADIYSTLLKTDNSNYRVQVGISETTNPVKLLLGIKTVAETIGGSCSIQGTLWYNSVNGTALVCNAGTIMQVGTTTVPTGLAISGNTAGTPAVISSGTITLAGGNNITLSQNGNAITVSAGAGGGGGAAVSAGTQSVSSGTVIFSNANNISFGMAGSQTVTASFSQSVQTQNAHNVTLSGNTAGVMAQISSGTMTLAGGNNITLSQNGNAITISAGAGGGGAGTFGMSNLGNSSGTSGTVQSQFLVAGGAGIIGSQSINGQSATLSIVNSWSTATTVSAITTANIIGANAGRFALEGHQHQGVAGIIPGGTASTFIGEVAFSAGPNITLVTGGNSTNATISISGGGGGGGGATLSNFQWPPGQSSLFGAYSNATMSLVPFQVQQNLTATRAAILGSHSIGTNTSGTTTGTWSLSIGIYTRNVSTLSLASSGSQTFSISNTSNASVSRYVGLRRFTVPININATPGEYWYAAWLRSSGNAQSLSIVGNAGTSAAFSGNFAEASGTTRHLSPWHGIYSTSFSTAMPASIASNVLNAGSAGTLRQPWILFSNFDF